MNNKYIKMYQKGATIVEFALILPLFITLVFGILEAGWALYLQNTLVDAAREGARVAVTQNVNLTTVTNAVDTVVANANIPTGQISVTVNPQAFNTEPRNSAISVTVAMPYQSAAILPTALFFQDVILQASVTMNKEY